MVRFARLIHRRGRALGGPSVRAAFGGNLSVPCLPPRVVPHERGECARPRRCWRLTGPRCLASGRWCLRWRCAAGSLAGRDLWLLSYWRLGPMIKEATFQGGSPDRARAATNRPQTDAGLGRAAGGHGDGLRSGSGRPGRGERQSAGAVPAQYPHGPGHRGSPSQARRRRRVGVAAAAVREPRRAVAAERGA